MWVHNKRTHHLKKLFETDPRLQGKLVRVNNCFSNNFINQTEDIRMDTLLEPYGCLGDLGWYTTRNILWAFNYELPTKVVGFSKRYPSTVENKKAIINFDAFLTFSNGRIASFSCSFEESQRQSSEIIFGDNHILIKDFVLPWDNEDVYFPRESYDKQATFELHELAGRFETVKCEPSSQHVELFEAFYHGACSPTEHSHWSDETHKTMLVLDALFNSSSQDGKPQTIPQN